MKKIQIVLLIMIVIGLGLLATQKYWVPKVVAFVLERELQEAIANSPFNIAYKIGDKEYDLDNGKFEKEISPNSASKETVQIFGFPAWGDLNGDGVEDAAMFLRQETGGSGSFFYVVLAINYEGKYRGTNAMFLGDRIAPQNINIIEGRAVANFAERKADEPMTTVPSLGKSVWVHLDEQNMQIGELVKDFEGESR